MTVDEIATEALAIEDPTERNSFLDQACGNDASLRNKVDALLAALEMAEQDSFLSSGMFGQPKPNSETPPDPTEAAVRSEAAGDGAARFTLRSRHAIGGLGEVWVAWDRQLYREVALKQIRREWANNLDAVARFRREAEITGFLEHPGVVPIYSLGDQQDGRPFYAMQFIRGRTLEQVVAEHLGTTQSMPGVPAQGRSPNWYDNATLRTMLDHFVDVCQTIDYAHNQDVVHRDLKPSNIMLGTYGQTLVVDWGLAKRLDRTGLPDEFGTAQDEIDQQLDASLSLVSQNDSSVDETRQGTALGTPRFMSPEQAAGKIDQIGPAADVYCLGATLYFILAGQAPHSGESDLKSTFDRIVEGRFEPPTRVRSEIPRPLQAIVMKSMATEISGRYASAGELAQDVQRFLADQSVSVFKDPPIERTLRWTRNHRALTAALAVAFLLTSLGSVSALFVRQEMNRRQMEADRTKAEQEREINFQAETRRLEAVAASNAAIERSEAAIKESRFADAAALIDVAIDRMENQDSMAEQRARLIEKRDRMERLGRFDSLRKSGEDFDHLAQDTEAAVLLQASLSELGHWDSNTWWNQLPDQDLSAVQRDRLRWKIYRILTALNSIYLSKMVNAMGGSSDGGTPSTLKMIRSYLSTGIGKREARATVEVTKRIQSFRTSESARWLGSIAAFRLNGGKRVEPKDLGPPRNAPDGQSLAVASLIASVDPNYRAWFSDYGDTFMEQSDEDPSLRALKVAMETLRRVSDQAADDYWVRLTLAQSYFLVAQRAETNDDYPAAIEHYELARSEYGRCIAIRPQTAFGFGDRSTVALRQAVLMRDHPGATAGQQQRATELLRSSFRDASEAKRLSPNSHWVYWHVGATAAELGQVETATEAFFKAVQLGFDVQDNLDSPMFKLDDLRGRTQAIEFAYRDAESIRQLTATAPAASRKATLIASLEFSRGNLAAARQWSSKAIELNPSQARAHQIAGWCAFRDQDWNQARLHFASAIEQSPDDVVSLIGAARVADQVSDAGDLEQSDRWYRQAIDIAISPRHRSSAWFGLAKRELRRGELEQAKASIDAARNLDPACDVNQFIDLSREEARRLLVLRKAADSESEKQAILDQIEELKSFLDYIASLPIASTNQIVDSASDQPPASLPLLGAEFELPIETYWNIQPITAEAVDQANRSSAILIGSPPITISAGTGVSASSGLTIRRIEANRETSSWRLSQSVPAASGQAYEISAMVKSINADRETATLVVRHADQELARLELSGEPNTYTRRSTRLQVPTDDFEFVSLDIQIEIKDPLSGSVLIDDLQTTR